MHVRKSIGSGCTWQPGYRSSRCLAPFLTLRHRGTVHLKPKTIRNLLITPQSSRRLCFCSPGAWADEDAEEPDTSEPRAEPSKEQPSEAGRASFFNALCLTIGGDITRLSGLQIGMALVEPTVILQA